MVEGKPYRYGLIAAGLCVMAVAMFIMIQERPHVYATLCALGVVMVTIGTVWSLCQCYPKVILVPQIQEERRPEDTSTDATQQSHAQTLLCFHGEKPGNSLLPGVLTSHCHSCPTLHLV